MNYKFIILTSSDGKIARVNKGNMSIRNFTESIIRKGYVSCQTGYFVSGELRFDEEYMVNCVIPWHSIDHFTFKE